MRIEYSPELSAHYGEPTWWLHEEDRDVSYEMRLSDLAKEQEDKQVRVAQNALRNLLLTTLGVADGVDVSPDGRGYVDSGSPPPVCDVDGMRAHIARQLESLQATGMDVDLTHVQWLVNLVCRTVDAKKPSDRSVEDRNYAVLRTDLEKCFSWARDRDL